MHTTIGSRLKVWRESASLKQTDAASLLGLPPNTYQNYERDVRSPNTQGWEAFAKAGINTNWLLTGQGPMLLADLAQTLATQESQAAYASREIGARADQLVGQQSTVGQQLKCWRLSCGMTQPAAAARLNAPPSAYQEYETDQRAPDAEALTRFVEAGINANWLLCNEGPMLLRDLAPKAPRINIEALAAIMEGALKAMPSASMAQIAQHSVEFYARCIEDGLITPDGVGPGKHGEAA